MASPNCKSKCTSTADKNPPSNLQEQYLFLLELYVREITGSRLAKFNEMFSVPTTIAFCFLDFNLEEGLHLTPVDPMFEPLAGIADDVEAFYNGRSVLFALTRQALSSANCDFKINMSVLKKMPEDIKPDVLVGKAQIDMSMHFSALCKELLDRLKYCDSALPTPSKCLDDDSVPLIFNGCVVGSMSTFSRVSVFGQTIVTEFEGSGDSSSCFLFKADDRLECDGSKPLGYRLRILEPDSCSSSSSQQQQSAAAAGDDCPVCKPPRLACAPCRVGSGATAASACTGRQKQACPAQPIQTSRGPKEPCGKAVVLKVSGLVDFCENPRGQEPARVTVAGEDEAASPAELSDPDHDVFVLRIGKKGLVGAGDKSDIQLEMRTPKGPEKRPPVRLETREMQTEEAAKAPSKKKK